MIAVSNDFKTEVKGDAKQLTAYARKDRTLNDGTLTNFARNNGTPAGGVTISDGAMVFDGVDGRVTFNPPTIIGVGTIEAWVNIPAFETKSISLYETRTSSGNFNNRFALLFPSDAGGRVRLSVNEIAGGTNTQTTDAIPFNELVHIVAVKTETQSYIYVNGVLASSLVANTRTPDTSSNAENRLGQATDSSAYNSYFVRVYNRALTTAEITEIYNAGKDSYSPIGSGLVAQYSGRDFAGTEATPTTIYDTNMIVKGKFDEAVSFDGVDDYITLPSDLQISSNNKVTVSFWSKTTEEIRLFQTSDNFNQQWSLREDRIYIRLADANTRYNSVFTQTNLYDNTWHHNLITIDDGVMNYYLDNVLIATDTKSPSEAIIRDIGRSKLGSATILYSDASILGLSALGRALSQEEITALYETQKNYEFEAGIPNNVLYLPLDAKNINHATNKATDLNIADLSYANNLKSIKLIQESDISSTMIRQVEITSWGADMLGGEYKVGIGVYIGDDVEYIDYGTFKIQKIEQRKGMEQVVATGYDKMYEALRRYDLNVTFPCTLKQYIEAICTRLGWELGTSSFLNDDLILEADLFSFQDFTFRDVLDQIAEVTCSVIRFGIDDKLYIQELKTVVDEAVTTSELRTLDVENKWGAINSVVFTENPVERNFVSVGGYYNPPILLENGEELLLENGEPYLSNRLVEIDDLWQIRYTNNLILGEDREGLIGDIATELTGKEFYPFKAKTIGLGYFEVGDLVTLEDLQGTQYQTYIMGVTVELAGGFRDSLEMIEPRKSRSNYKKEAGVITKELIDSQLGESNIEDGAVSTAKIRDASITNAKIEDASITNAKIEDASITNAKIQELSADKITTGTLDVETRIIIKDATHDRILLGDIS